MAVAAGLWDKPIPLPGSNEAVGEIYGVDGDTAHIKIEGALSPEGPDAWDLFFGYKGASYKTIQAAMERAKTDPTVKSVRFLINSPGGTLDQCDETWQAHKALAAVKPTEVHAEFLASAAYWISAPANKILATSPTSEMGSIGVLVATYDWSSFEEKIGIKEVVITSSNAPEKYPDISTEHGRNTIKSQLDALERIFYSRVSEGRGVTNKHIAEHFGRGGLLVAQDPSAEHEDAIRAGMIDGLIDDDISATEIESNTTPVLIVDEKGARFENRVPMTLNEMNEVIRQNQEQPSCEGKNNPAPAGTGGSAMQTLQEFMAQNPAASAEVNNLVDRAREGATAQGRADAKAEFSALAERIMPVMSSDAYPSHVRTLGCEVLAGKKGIDAFDAVVAMHDMNAEKAKSDAAQKQTEELGGITAEAPSNLSAADKGFDAALQSELDKRKGAKQ
jgi:ClpP class serine protease